MPRMRLLCLLTLLQLGGALWAQDPLAIPNGSFEALDAATGLPERWTVWQQPGNTAAYTLAIAHSGVAAASVTDDSATVSQGLRSLRVPIKPGESYRGSVWVFIDRLQASGFALYLEFWHGDTRVLDRAASTTEKGHWVELCVEAQAPANAEHATLLIYGSSATIGHAYFDDAKLERKAL